MASERWAPYLAQLPTLGRDHVNRLLTDHEQLSKSEAALRDATSDSDIFKEAAYSGGLTYVYDTPSELSDTERSNLGALRAVVKDAIAREQLAKGRKLTIDEQRSKTQEIVDQKVRVDRSFFSYFGDRGIPRVIESWGAALFGKGALSPWTVGAFLSPDERKKAYVLFKDIDAQPELYGQAYIDALNYLRGLAGNAGLSETQLRYRYWTRIQNAIGRRFAGGTRQEIEAALNGQ